MKIWTCLEPQDIFLDLALPDKRAALRFAADTFARRGIVRHAEDLYRRMCHREAVMSTGIGGGVGVPHAASPEAERAAILLIRPERPIDFDALDGAAVRLILAMVVPEDETFLHLRILAGISRLCRNSAFRNAVEQAREGDRLWEAIRSLENDMAFH